MSCRMQTPKALTRLPDLLRNRKKTVPRKKTVLKSWPCWWLSRNVKDVVGNVDSSGMNLESLKEEMSLKMLTGFKRKKKMQDRCPK